MSSRYFLGMAPSSRPTILSSANHALNSVGACLLISFRNRRSPASWECSLPLGVGASASRALGSHFAPGGEHVIVYHLVIEGRAFVRLESGERITVNAGEIVMIPHGDRHILENGPPTPTVDDSHQLGQ